MPCIREKRQRIRQDTTRQASSQNDQCQEKGQAQCLSCHPMRVIMTMTLLLVLYNSTHADTSVSCSRATGTPGITEATPTISNTSRVWAILIVNNWRICSSTSR